jgi:hypothetical protein
VENIACGEPREDIARHSKRKASGQHAAPGAITAAPGSVVQLGDAGRWCASVRARAREMDFGAERRRNNLLRLGGPGQEDRHVLGHLHLYNIIH